MSGGCVDPDPRMSQDHIRHLLPDLLVPVLEGTGQGNLNRALLCGVLVPAHRGTSGVIKTAPITFSVSSFSSLRPVTLFLEDATLPVETLSTLALTVAVEIVLGPAPTQLRVCQSTEPYTT